MRTDTKEILPEIKSKKKIICKDSNKENPQTGKGEGHVKMCQPASQKILKPVKMTTNRFVEKS